MRVYLLGLLCFLLGCPKPANTNTATTPNPPTEGKETKPPDGNTPTETVSTGPIVVSVEVVKGGADRKFLSSGSTLKSGERFEAFVQVDKPAYVYVMVLSSDNSIAVLLPEEGDIKLKPGVKTRLPTDAEVWMEMDDVPGVEHLFFIAASAPISQADEKISNHIGKIRSGEVKFSAVEEDKSVGSPPSQNFTKLNEPAEEPKPDPKSPPKEKPPKKPAERSCNVPPKAISAGLNNRMCAPSDGLSQRGVKLSKDTDAKVEMQTDPSGVAIAHIWFHHK